MLVAPGSAAGRDRAPAVLVAPGSAVDWEPVRAAALARALAAGRAVALVVEPARVRAYQEQARVVVVAMSGDPPLLFPGNS